MKIVKVTYTTKAEYAAENRANISAVMAALRQLNHPGIHYHVCTGADDHTFIHTAFFKSEEDQHVLFQLAEFKQFQDQLNASVPVAAPRQEILTFVGSSKEIFN